VPCSAAVIYACASKGLMARALWGVSNNFAPRTLLPCVGSRSWRAAIPMPPFLDCSRGGLLALQFACLRHAARMTSLTF